MTTSTRDDRVHPYHARSFVKRVLDVYFRVTGKDASKTPDHVLYYENIEGGHGGAADNKQQAFMNVYYYALSLLQCLIHCDFLQVLFIEFFQKVIG
jgi:prolyl oligopeptidase